MTNQSTITNNSQPVSGFPANFLKIFAAMTMLIDHAALTLVYAKLAKFPEYLNIVFSASATQEQIDAIPIDYLNIYSTYAIMRLVGRIAFPIFAFLIFEGFMHTSDYKRYLIRVGLCALIAEIPFNLIVSNTAPIYGLTDVTVSVFYPQHQNTVFTLFLALLMLYGMKRFESSEITLNPKAAFKQWFGQLLCVVVACILSVFLRTDYSYIGILFIAVLYFFRTNKKLQILFGCIIFLSTNIASLLAFVPIAMYNGHIIRSRKFKYFFYIFYPAHLLVLYLISLAM